MRLVSFDALRSLGIEGVTYVKPAHMFKEINLLREADWLLFPEYWQVNTLLYGLKAKIFPSPASYHLGHNKVEMTRWLEMVSPANVPLTLILANTPAHQYEVLQQFDFPFVVKEVKSSRGEGVKLITCYREFAEHCATVDTLYAQEYLPIDRDLRLVVIGQKVVGGYWRIQSDNGFHNNVYQGGRLMFGPLPIEAVNLVERLAQQANIDHAGFDIAMVDGHCYVFEFNRLFGNQGLSELGVDTGKLIYDHLLSQSGSHQDPPRSVAS